MVPGAERSRNMGDRDRNTWCWHWVLEVSVALWHSPLPVAGLLSLLSNSTHPMLPTTREGWSSISGLCNQETAFSHCYPQFLTSNFAFLQPFWTLLLKDPLKTPWVMSFLSKRLINGFVLEREGVLRNRNPLKMT